MIRKTLALAALLTSLAPLDSTAFVLVAKRRRTTTSV